MLSIGPHVLEGKFVKLPNPLLVLQREDGAVVTGTEPGHAYQVAGIVHEKLLFKTRPKMSLTSR